MGEARALVGCWSGRVSRRGAFSGGWVTEWGAAWDSTHAAPDQEDCLGWWPHCLCACPLPAKSSCEMGQPVPTWSRCPGREVTQCTKYQSPCLAPVCAGSSYPRRGPEGPPPAHLQPQGERGFLGSRGRSASCPHLGPSSYCRSGTSPREIRDCSPETVGTGRRGARAPSLWGAWCLGTKGRSSKGGSSVEPVGPFPDIC